MPYDYMIMMHKVTVINGHTKNISLAVWVSYLTYIDVWTVCQEIERKGS
jgi:hypothetical protein